MTEKGRNPDILTMTATPIPRTLSSIFFSDFSLSSIDSLPPSRGTIETRIEDIEDIEEVFSFVKHELDTGRQAFVLCPLINKSDNLEFQNLADVESVYSQLRKRKLKDHKLAILHGRLSTEEKERTMDDFKNKKIDILVSTTVVEVGVDIPNASIMIIYNPERFGLSQLHQLRGRIGRGSHSSYCILLVDEINSDSSDRLSIFKEISDGFILSEKDLEIRGPGAFYGAGVEQSGKFWDLCLANLRRDSDILKDAKSCSETIQDSDCYKKNTKIIDDLLYRLWGEKLELTKTI
jgi:ATP-dependent DNA helicase RecG